jgi:two-component system sensor histidine kinase VanS
VDRTPRLSVRLKLTLSYAGFLMLAGAVLLVVGYFSLSRGVHPGVIFMVRSHADLLRSFAPPGAIVMAFLLVFGLVGGWILAGHMLASLTRITDATRMAADGSLSHRIELEGRRDEFRELADVFDAMLARLEAHVAEQQRFAANASHELRTPLAITQTLLDVARNDRNGDVGELIDRLHTVNTRAIDAHTHRPRRRRPRPGTRQKHHQAHEGALSLTPRAAGGLRVTVQLPATPPHTGTGRAEHN